MQRPWLILLSAASSFSIVVAASGLGGAPVACRTPDRDRSRRLIARENPGENLRRRNIVRSGVASALRSDDRKRGQACGTRIAIAGIQQGAQGDAKIDIAGLQRGIGFDVAGRYVVEH